MIQFGILGATGRMGRWVCELLQNDFSSEGSVIAQPDRSDPLTPLLNADVVIDFSSPAAVCELLKLGLKHPARLPALVVGSTGWSAADLELLKEFSTKSPVLISSNFSTGVFVLSEILRNFAPVLEKLGYTAVISETHHRHKKDAPSGTAILLQKCINPKNPRQIQTHSIRAGEVVGDHHVTFYGPVDRITLSHSAQNRSIFARGAIEVALWLAKKRNSSEFLQGMFSMDSYFEAQRAVRLDSV